MYLFDRSADGIVTVTFRETVTVDEVLQAVEDVNRATEDQASTRLLLVFDDPRLPPLLAMKERLRHSQHIRPLIGRTDRAAVLTDQFWVRTASRAQAMLVAKIATRDFPMSRRDDALAFLRQAGA